MKDVNVKFVKSKIASAVISVNGEEIEVNSPFPILAKIYNEMYDTNLDFDELVKKYESQKK